MSTKILGLIIKIIYTRMMDQRSIGLYSLIMPTYLLVINIGSMAMPITISKLVADGEDIKLINTASIIIFIINFSLMLLIFILAPFIANNLIHVKESVYLLYSCAICLPFTSLACILKGYFYGKQKMIPHVISNTIEQIIRIVLIIFFMPYFIKISYVHAACFLIITSFFTELSSIIVFLISMNKNDRIIISKINYNSDYYHKIMNISLPLVSTRIINNIAYFFEPLIITNTLITNPSLKDLILSNYGAYNAYAIGTLSVPSFFISAIASSLLPELTKSKDNKHMFKKRCLQAFVFTFIIGGLSTLIITIFRKELLLFLYNTNDGCNYIKLLGPFFILFYFEAILSTIIQSVGKTKTIFKITIISSISKVIITYVLCLLIKNIYGLIYSEILNIILVILLYSIEIKNLKLT